MKLQKKNEKIDELNQMIDQLKVQNNDEIIKKDNEIKELKIAKQQFSDQNRDKLTKLNKEINALKIANEQILTQKKVEINELNTKIKELKKQSQERIAKMNEKITSLKDKNQQINNTQQNEEFVKKDNEINQLKETIQKKEKQFEDEIGKNNKEIMTYMIKNKLKSEYSYEIIKELMAKRGDIKNFIYQELI